MTQGNAAGALFYLWYTSLRNRLRAQRGRLRQPRQLVALALGGAYLWWIVRMNGSEETSPFAALGSSGVGTTVVSALLLLFAAHWWLMKPDRSALAFSPAEAHMLFPAPVTRRTLVQSKLLRGQVAILANVIIWVVLLRGGGSSVEGWQRGIALWLLFSTFTLHRLAAALVRVNAEQNRVAGWKRSAIPAAVFTAMFGTVAVLLWRARTAIRAALVDGPGAALRLTGEVLDVPAGALVLAPVRALVAPVFAGSSQAWLLSLGPALLVLVLHYVWVLRTDAAFEEAALEASQERARRIAAISGKELSAKRSRRGGVARVFPLPAWGHPAITIAWKNAAAAIRGGGWLRQLLIIAGTMAVMLTVFRVTVGIPLELVIGLTSVWGFMLLLIGPVWMRYDLRLDLRDLTTLRTLPLSGRSIVSAEIVGVSLLHAVSIFAFLIVPVLFAISTPALRAQFLSVVTAPVPTLLGVVLLVPAFTLLTFTVQNGLAVMYPSWVQLGTERRGFEAMGQTMLTTGFTAVASAIAMVFPVLVGLAVGFIARIWVGAWSIPVGLAAALLVVLAELVPIWIALGGILDQMEPSDVPGQRA